MYLLNYSVFLTLEQSWSISDSIFQNTEKYFSQMGENLEDGIFPYGRWLIVRDYSARTKSLLHRQRLPAVYATPAEGQQFNLQAAPAERKTHKVALNPHGLSCSVVLVSMPLAKVQAIRPTSFFPGLWNIPLGETLRLLAFSQPTSKLSLAFLPAVCFQPICLESE